MFLHALLKKCRLLIPTGFRNTVDYTESSVVKKKNPNLVISVASPMLNVVLIPGRVKQNIQLALFIPFDSFEIQKHDVNRLL